MYDYQVKKMLHTYDIPIPRGYVVNTPGQLLKAAEAMDWHCAIKTMCNGKPGEVKRLDCIEQSGEMVKEIFGNDSYNFQANSEKHEKRFVLVEEMMDSARKLYLSITPDYFSSFYWVLATAEENKVNAGGNQAPHGSAYKLAINPFAGLRPQQACEFARALGLTGYLGEEYADLIHNTYRLCLDKECSLVEIDPLVITKEGWLVAQEARISFDEDAVYYR